MCVNGIWRISSASFHFIHWKNRCCWFSLLSVSTWILFPPDSLFVFLFINLETLFLAFIPWCCSCCVMLVDVFNCTDVYYLSVCMMARCNGIVITVSDVVLTISGLFIIDFWIEIKPLPLYFLGRYSCFVDASGCYDRYNDESHISLFTIFGSIWILSVTLNGGCLIFNFLKSLITTWRKHELLRWLWHSWNYIW